MKGDWAQELGDDWVTLSPGIYVRKEDLEANTPKLRVAPGVQKKKAKVAK